MALTVAQIDTLIEAHRANIEAAALGLSYAINGREHQRVSPKESLQIIRDLQALRDIITDATGGLDLVTIGRQS